MADNYVNASETQTEDLLEQLLQKNPARLLEENLAGVAMQSN